MAESTGRKMDACTKESLIPHFAPFKEVLQSSSGSLQDSRRHAIADRIEFNPPLSPLLPPGASTVRTTSASVTSSTKEGRMMGRKGVAGTAGGGGGGGPNLVLSQTGV